MSHFNDLEEVKNEKMGSEMCGFDNHGFLMTEKNLRMDKKVFTCIYLYYIYILTYKSYNNYLCKVLSPF